MATAADMVIAAPESLRDDKPGVLIFRKRLLPYSETFIANQALALQRYTPCFVGLERHEQGVHYIEESRMHLLDDATPNLTLARFRLKLGLGRNHPWLQSMQASRPALVHAHFGNGATDARVIARALRLPLLITWHGHDISKPLTGAFGRQVRQAIGIADHCIAVSGFIADRLRAAGCAEHKLSVLPTGVQLPPADRVTPVPNNGRVLFVGRLVAKKGVTHLIDAMASVQKRHPNAHLHIAGDGPLDAQLAAQAKRQGVAVRFLGRLSQQAVFDSMRDACVIAAPSVQTPRDVEGLGMVFVEAQALGRPVVGFASGGIPDAVRNGHSGLLVEEGDSVALADALVSILGDADRATGMGRAARDFAAGQHDLQTQSGKLEAIYDRLVGDFTRRD